MDASLIMWAFIGGTLVLGLVLFVFKPRSEQRYIGRNARYSGFRADGSVVEGELIINDEMDDQEVMDYIAKYLRAYGMVGKNEYYSLSVQYVDIWER